MRGRGRRRVAAIKPGLKRICGAVTYILAGYYSLFGGGGSKWRSEISYFGAVMISFYVDVIEQILNMCRWNITIMFAFQKMTWRNLSKERRSAREDTLSS